MTPEPRFAAFDAWYEKYDPDMENGAPNDFEDAHVYWMQCAWQASRKAALEAALKIVEDTREYTRFDAVQAIKEMME